MINVFQIRKNIMDSVAKLVDLDRAIQKFSDSLSDAEALKMVEEFGEVEHEMNILTANLKNSLTNMIKLAGNEQEELDVAVEEDENGYKIV